ncbi:MAG: hypothetical protein OXH32_07395 [Acidobacteria bacterium]|nr:hypothetical protein [Acidobacteriota bacterium]
MPSELRRKTRAAAPGGALASALPVVGWAGGAFLGAVLVFGGVVKALDPQAFVKLIEIEGLDFLLPAVVVTAIALALEMGLGSALILGLRRMWVLGPSALLVAFFLFLTGRAYYRDLRGIATEDEAGCGCFGNLVERTPAEAFWQDLALMVPALALAFLGRRAAGGAPWIRLAVVGTLTVGLLAFARAAPDLPLDNLATRLKPDLTIDEICSGAADSRLCLSTIVPELEEGAHWLVIADLDEDLGKAVDALNQHVFAGGRMWVLSSATPDENRAFFWSYGPAFEIREAPPTFLNPLYRTLPRSFRVEGGVVVETVSGLPPEP